jgi:hypothetical protein
VAFVSTFVAVAEDQVSYIRRPYIRLILDASTAMEAVEIIKSFNPKIGGNMFVADSNNCFGIEGVPEKYHIEQLIGPAVKTNHFVALPYRNLSFDSVPGFREWSTTRYLRAQELIASAANIEDFKQLLRDRKNAKENNAICRTRDEFDCFTHSAFIFDTAGRKTYYAQGNPLETEFKEYGF